VDSLRQHFLTGAAFAQNQDRGISSRDFAHGGENPLDLRAGAEQPLKSLRLKLRLQLAIVALQPGNVKGATENNL